MNRASFVLALVVTLASAQEWVDIYGHNGEDSYWGLDVAVDRQGNAYGTGSSAVPGMRAFPCVVRYGANGQHVWTRVLDLGDWVNPMKSRIAVTASGLVVAAGTASASSIRVVYLAALSTNGDSVWAETLRVGMNVYSQEFGMALDNRGFIYVTATGVDDSTGNDIFTAKVRESDGQVMWRAYYDGPRAPDEEGWGIAADTGGNAYVVGKVENVLGKSKPVLLKYGPTGTLLWVKMFGIEGEANGYYTDVLVANDGYVYAAGADEWTYQAPIAKYSTAGDSVWNILTPGYTRRITMGEQGYLYATGWSQTGNIMTWKVSPSGSITWSRAYEGPDSMWDEGACVAYDPLGYVAVAGASDYLNGKSDIAVIRYSTAGQQQWVGRYRYSTSQQPTGIATDAQGSIYVSGYGRDSLSTYRDVWITLKYPASGAVEEQPTPRPGHQSVIAALPSVVSLHCRFTLRSGRRQSSLTIADASGRTVRELTVPGRGTAVLWDVRDEVGQPVPNGIYFARLASGVTRDASSVAKLIVQR